jgi:N-acetylmuramoyl-L-alanine amidase
VVALLLACVAPAQAQTNAEQLFKDAIAREAALRHEIDTRKAASPAVPLLRSARILVGAYEDMARLFPASPYSDNALWQGGMLAADSFWEFGEAADRVTALRLLNALATRYRSSTLVKQAAPQISRLASASPQTPAVATTAAAPAKTTPAAATAPGVAMLTSIRREVLPEALRITLSLEKEASFYDERLDAPARVFIDLQNARSVDALKDTTLTYSDDVVRQIRVGRQLGARVRIVFDLEHAGRHSVYALYNPFRIVIDFERPAAAHALETVKPPPTVEAPKPNADGGLSLSRQLGLGIARIVIDPGHGGHDPGAQAKGLSEADLVLDIALRLEKLLLKQRGVEVVMTRRTDEFVALEERTAMANREQADLFLSIHANASDDVRARGVETYFLNFAPNPQAEAIAARENAGAARTMRSLPDILKAIALNNKIDESRDFASLVQAAMVDRLRKADRSPRNLGVRQAPFMVLIGATMPSVLTEISFVTNRQEQTWLKTQTYRQQLAEALFDGIMKYQKSLKGAQVAAR